MKPEKWFNGMHEVVDAPSPEKASQDLIRKVKEESRKKAGELSPIPDTKNTKETETPAEKNWLGKWEEKHG